MKNKTVVNALRETIVKVLDNLSVNISQALEKPQLFQMLEHDSLLVKNEETGDQEPAYGILVEYGEPEKLPVLLYRRVYAIDHNSLNDVRQHAFTELIEAFAGNFCMISLGQHRMIEARKAELANTEVATDEPTEESEPTNEQES